MLPHLAGPEKPATSHKESATGHVYCPQQRPFCQESEGRFVLGAGRPFFLGRGVKSRNGLVSKYSDKGNSENKQLY